MPFYQAKICYDGTPFFGWQKTKTGPSVQAALESALFELTQEIATPEAASRTDRGVHADGQTIGFSLTRPASSEKLQRGLNAILPPEIRILSMEETTADFHPTLHAKAKEYHYRICSKKVQDHIHRLYSWHVHYPLDRSLMIQAASLLIGKKDFSSFANEPEENPVCDLKKIVIEDLAQERLQISLIGDRFLYKMVRTIVGTLVDVGRGKIDAGSIQYILQQRQRPLAGVTAPAHGLFLHQVFYDRT